MNIITLHKYKVLYFSIPKTGCTSIKWFCANLLYPKEDIAKWEYRMPSPMWEHKVPFHFVSKEEAGKCNNYFKFCFVRNPWDKLVSFYCDKLNINNPSHRDFLKYNGFKVGISFEELVYAIRDIQDREAERHFKSQYTFVTDQRNNLVVDFVGRFENLEEDFNKICKIAGLPPIALPHRYKSVHDHYSTYYTDETRRVVAERYKKDIEMFGYDFL